MENQHQNLSPDFSFLFPGNICKQVISEKLNHDNHDSHNAILDSTHVCDVCKKHFTRISSLNKHSLMHIGHKPHICDVCNKSFRRVNELNKHYFIHTGNKPHTCDVCFRSFTQTSTLQKHYRTHTGEKPHVCDICGTGFTQISSLQNHLLIHTGEKPYACNLCNKSFSQLGNLQKHTLTHTGEKPFICDVCDVGFTRKCSLQRHYLMHNRKESLVTNMSDKDVLQRDVQQDNFRDLTAKMHTCTICNRTFTRKGNLQKHYVLHDKEQSHANFTKKVQQMRSMQKYFLIHSKEKYLDIDDNIRDTSDLLSPQDDVLIHPMQTACGKDDFETGFHEISSFQKHSITHHNKTPYIHSINKTNAIKSNLSTPYIHDFSNMSQNNSIL